MSALTFAEIQAQAALAASTGDDMNEVQKGGGGGKLMPEGMCLARLVGLIELGKQPQEFKGVAKDPELEFQLIFALYGAGYGNDDGTPYIMKTYGIKLSRNEKAGAYLLFKSLNWKGTATHFAQLIGSAYLLKIVNKAPQADPQGKKTSRIDLKGFLPPIDPISRMEYPIPEAREEDLRLFLWDHPTMAGWNSLYIDGNNEDGSSKNWIQNEILSATDFAGSALETMLVSNGVAFTRPAPKPTAGSVGALPTGAVAPPTVVAPVGLPTPGYIPATLPGNVGGALPNVSTPVMALNQVVSPVASYAAVAGVTQATPQGAALDAAQNVGGSLPNVAAVPAPVVTAPLGLMPPALPVAQAAVPLQPTAILAPAAPTGVVAPVALPFNVGVPPALPVQQ